jgi:hypothetical protein
MVGGGKASQGSVRQRKKEFKQAVKAPGGLAVGRVGTYTERWRDFALDSYIAMAY